MSVVGINNSSRKGRRLSNSSSVPSGWRMVNVQGQRIYLSEKERVAMLTKPRGRRASRRSSKLNMESGTFVLQPHDNTLPEAWEKAVVLSPDGETGTWIWHNLKTGSTSIKDPSQAIFENGNPLPTGFSIAYDDEGDVFFIDHNSGSVSYDDPRLVCTEVLGCDAERVAESTLSTLARRRSSDQDSNDDTDSSLGPRSGRSSVADDSSPPGSPGLTPSDAGDTAHTAAPLAADGAQELPGDAEMAPEQQATPWLLGKVNHYRFNTMPQYLTPKTALPLVVTGKALNRYTNILPNPGTRVVLDDEHEPKTDVSTYINANYVPSIDGSQNEYIAAMGPLDNTIEAFWRMVWMEDSPAIVMTTPMMENGVTKCSRYWPTVKFNHEKQLGDKQWGEFRVAVLCGARHPGYILTKIRLIKGEETRILDHYWFQDWPDHGVPGREGATNIVQMMRAVRQTCQQEGKGPAVVHCSAGIGRTGTFIAIDHCIQEMEAHGQVEPLEVIERLRKARGGMVQHPQQYDFVHKACVEYARRRLHPLTLQERLYPSDTKGDGTEERDEATPPSSQRGFKPGEWKQSVKSKKPQVLMQLVSKGRPPDMPEEEWLKANRKLVKQQATLRAASSVRRKLDDAEMHGELRLGTLSGGTNDGKYRPSVQQIFADQATERALAETAAERAAQAVADAVDDDGAPRGRATSVSRRLLAADEEEERPTEMPVQAS